MTSSSLVQTILGLGVPLAEQNKENSSPLTAWDRSSAKKITSKLHSVK